MATATSVPEPVHDDFSCDTPEEMLELDTLQAKAEVRTDGRTDLNIYTDDELDALERLSAIAAAHEARIEGTAVRVEADADAVRSCASRWWP